MKLRGMCVRIRTEGMGRAAGVLRGRAGSQRVGCIEGVTRLPEIIWLIRFSVTLK